MTDTRENLVTTLTPESEQELVAALRKLALKREAAGECCIPAAEMRWEYGEDADYMA